MNIALRQRKSEEWGTWGFRRACVSMSEEIFSIMCCRIDLPRPGDWSHLPELLVQLLSGWFSYGTSLRMELLSNVLEYWRRLDQPDLLGPTLSHYPRLAFLRNSSLTEKGLVFSPSAVGHERGATTESARTAECIRIGRTWGSCSCGSKASLNKSLKQNPADKWSCIIK